MPEALWVNQDQSHCQVKLDHKAERECYMMPKQAIHLTRVLFLCVSSPLREGVPAGERSMHSQKENKSSTQNLGPSLSAAAVLRRESRGKSLTGAQHFFFPCIYVSSK